MNKKVLFGLMCPLVLVPTATSIYYGVKYNNVRQESQTQDNSGLLQTIEELRAQVKTLTTERDNLLAQLSTLQSSNNEYQSLVTILQTQLGELQTQYDNDMTLSEEEKTELQSRINKLEADIATLNEEHEAELANLNEQLTQLQADLLVANNEITRIEGLLESYEELSQSAIEVNFYNGDTLLQTKAVAYGSTIDSIEEPTLEEGDVFEGWSLDGFNIIDPSTIKIVESTNYYAVVTKTMFSNESGKNITSSGYTFQAKDYTTSDVFSIELSSITCKLVNEDKDLIYATNGNDYALVESLDNEWTSETIKLTNKEPLILEYNGCTITFTLGYTELASTVNLKITVSAETNFNYVSAKWHRVAVYQ